MIEPVIFTPSTKSFIMFRDFKKVDFPTEGRPIIATTAVLFPTDEVSSFFSVLISVSSGFISSFFISSTIF